MQNLKFPIGFTTAVLFLYTATAALNFPFAIVFWLFVLVNGLLIWTVYKVLKDGIPSQKTFDEAFYEDYHAKTEP